MISPGSSRSWFSFISGRALLAAGAVLFAAVFSHPLSAADLPAKKLLFFSKSSGFEHSAIKQVDGKPSFAQGILTELAAKNGLAITFSKDGSLFTPDYLNQFDGFIFYTTGDLTTAGTDKNPPMSAAGKEALLAAIQKGKGFVGIHSATDTFHSHGDEGGGTRYKNFGDKADPYIKMLGGEFIHHGSQQKSRMIPGDTNFAGLKKLPAAEPIQEEWYSLKEFAPDLHVILAQETEGMKGNDYERPNYPATWAHLYGKGRVFYTSLGHRDDVWTSPEYQDLLLAGINWSTGRVDSDVTPNIATVTPQANTLPVYKPSEKKKPDPAAEKK